ncbi:MAG: hypothetical protein GY757_57275 [bacterium]|nr:hypothetical protein [bacterium]
MSWSSKIWTDLNFNWPHWGDFKEFRIYRGYTSNFAANSSSLIASQTGYSYSDSGFSSGTTVYYKIAAVNDNSESGTTQTVSVTVPGGGTLNPILSVSRNKLSFAAISGGSNPPTQEFRVSNAGTGALNWTAADGAAWLTCTPDSSSAGATVTASVDISGLAVGTYSASISISAPNADNSPHSIVIMLTVKSASQDIAPFGDFSSPDDGSTVSSSIPVTGWVLDDMGVESVKIYRDATAGEGTGLIYIGDALFVEGARADIEAAYPDLPANYLAGWGYMMLSHFLPNGGNGTFTLHAIARDTTGNEVSLGTKTITVDNANATRPFGAIDTPAQGGSASGTGYWNAGWVLTPMSNMIPVDGSTINVYVNGINMGHPQYNLSRPDIAGYFPAYANSAGAGGRLQIDTTAIGDGIHTISWVATDNAGNSDGIGSRFFTIQNSGSTDTAQTAAFKKTLVYNHTGLSKIPFDQSQPVDCIKGYGKSKLPVSPGKKGAINLEIKELERVEINLDSPGYLLGYLVVGNQFKALPSGSTLDTKKGVFYWQPGPGFIGSYTFDFFTAAAKDNHINSIKRKRVKINITPKFKK